MGGGDTFPASTDRTLAAFEIYVVKMGISCQAITSTALRSKAVLKVTRGVGAGISFANRIRI